MFTNDSIATLVCLSVCSRFNAAIPFLIVIVVTFVGMILSGYYTILYKNSQVQEEDDKNQTYSQNAVTYATAYSSFSSVLRCRWSTFLAMVTLSLLSSGAPPWAL